MSIIDTIQKLKIQAGALMRGIHPDYVLIERKDLEELLAAHEEATKHQIGSTDSVWLKLPDEFKHDLQSRTKEIPMDKLRPVGGPNCEHRYTDYHGRDIGHCYYCGEEKTMSFCGGIPIVTYVPPKLEQDWEPTKPIPPCDGMTAAQMKEKQDKCEHFWVPVVYTIRPGDPRTVCTYCNKAKPEDMASSSLGLLTKEQLDTIAQININRSEVASQHTSYPDITGTKTVSYIPMRANVAADCAHEWIAHPEQHSTRCKHCGATRSES